MGKRKLPPSWYLSSSPHPESPNLSHSHGIHDWRGVEIKVSEQRVGDGELIFFKGTKTQASCTVVLRGANDFMLDEMDR